MDQFDHHSQEFAQDWRGIYAGLRAGCPVAHSDQHGGFFVMARADDILRALRDSATFASAPEPIDGKGRVGGVTIPANPFRMGIMEMDPPESTRYRRLLNPWFSRNAVEEFRPRMRHLVTWCIDRFADRGVFDIVDDLANPVPALVTLARIGLPLDRWHPYARVLHEAVYREPGSAARLKWLFEDLKAIVRDGEGEPDGMLDHLRGAEIYSQSLSDRLIVEFVYMLLSGGIDSTTALIANVLRHLDEFPDDRQLLIAQPDLIPTAVQELIRFYSPATGVARTVTCPTMVSGVELQPGDRVLLALGSAAGDESKFEDAGRADLTREKNPHLAFGSGAHRCLGADLASAEMEILLGEVLTRLPDYRVDRARTVRYPSIPLVNGYIAMPATFTPASRLLAETDRDGDAIAVPPPLLPEVAAGPLR